VPAPRLSVSIHHTHWLNLSPPDLGPRAWMLGVVALQVSIEDNAVVARARAHVTGGEMPQVKSLESGAVLHVSLLETNAPPPALPALPPMEGARGGREPSVELFLDGEFVDRAVLTTGARAAVPPARGFGHVFCRWLRNGGFEPGFDLTDFVSQPLGQKFERRVNRPLELGQTVSYRLYY
jgi:hypothetical protein